MSDKPFLTYRQQLKRIKDKRILVADDDFVLEILKKIYKPWFTGSKK